MEKLGDIEFRVTGRYGNQELTPDNYDIKHIALLLQNVEDLLFPNNKRERPLITYNIQEGSVKHIFKTTIQTVIGFSAVLSQIYENKSIDFLELKTANAIESIQELAVQKNYEFYIKTSLNANYELKISPHTNYYRTENIWADAEFYFYGVLKDAGGKNKANIHLDTDDYGYLTIETGEGFLKEREENLLYKSFGVRAKGKQNIHTGELDTKTLRLMELINYSPKFDSSYIQNLILKAKKNWKDIDDPDSWINDLRGRYEA